MSLVQQELERRVKLLSEARAAFLLSKRSSPEVVQAQQPPAKKKRKRKKSAALSPAAGDTGKDATKAEIEGDAQYSVPDSVSEHPFATDVGDHCETPFEAYADIAPMLHGLARSLSVDSARLRIYDPYFCEGAVCSHLAKLGFHNVINENVDFYKAPKPSSAYDVLVTNPPYSGEHVPRLLRFCADLSSQAKPWLLCLPAYVHDKSYYGPIVTPSLGVSYVWPWRRYAYWSPGGIRGRAMAVAPFESVWHIGAVPAALVHWRSSGGAVGVTGRASLSCALFETLEELKSATKHSQIARTPKRPNPKARKRAAAKVAGLRANSI